MTLADSAAPPAWFTAALAAPVTQRATMVADAPIAYRAWGEPGAAASCTSNTAPAPCRAASSTL